MVLIVLDALVFAGDRFVSEDIIRFCDKQVRNMPIPKVMVHHPYAGEQDNAAESGFSPHQLVANAIRFTSEHRDLYVRIGERMFCILLRLENGESADFA